MADGSFISHKYRWIVLPAITYTTFSSADTSPNREREALLSKKLSVRQPYQHDDKNNGEETKVRCDI